MLLRTCYNFLVLYWSWNRVNIQSNCWDFDEFVAVLLLIIMDFSQLIRLARMGNHVTDINSRNKCLTVKFLQQGLSVMNFEKHFLNFKADTLS